MTTSTTAITKESEVLLNQLEEYKTLKYYCEVLKRQHAQAQKDLQALQEFKRSLEEDEDEEEEKGLFLDEKKLFIHTQVVVQLPEIEWSVYEQHVPVVATTTTPPTQKKANGTKRKRVIDDGEEDEKKSSNRKSRGGSRK